MAGAESCLKQGCHIIAVTLGKGMKLELGQGTGQRTAMAVCYFRDTGNKYTIESTSRDIASEADTTGAGDAFATDFCMVYLRAKGLRNVVIWVTL